ncbi:MAG: metallophosphoesterase, partial [Planctomycetaceae bacterium]|nr:metallophosphoesterase [Planctomycetaceae bacterium]
MYDIIGDIHGYADELVRLLESLGYRSANGVYRHPQRRVVFCGDFIDRGPQIRETLTIARAMVQDDAALAVMGNHEFNALAYHTAVPGQGGEFLRRHTDRNRAQHHQTIEQLNAAELASFLDWMRSLPVWLDLGTIRIVHACWSAHDFAVITQAAEQTGLMSEQFLVQATQVGHALFESIERVLKGPEMELPDGHVVVDKEGFQRRRIRTRWFVDPTDHTLGTYALPARHEEELRQAPLPTGLAGNSYPAYA